MPIATRSCTSYVTNSITTTTLHILQFICKELRDKQHEIFRLMDQHNILITALQKTELTPYINISTRKHIIVRQYINRGGIGIGIAFLI